MKRLFIFLLLTGVGSQLVFPLPLIASESRHDCRSAVVRDFRNKQLTREQMRQRLDQCPKKKNQECDREALRRSGGDKAAFQRNRRACLRAKGQATSPALPLRIANDSLWIDQIQIGQLIAQTALPAEWDCSRLQHSLSTGVDEHFSFFGNHPHHFRGWNRTPSSLWTSLARRGEKGQTQTERFSTIAGIGRLHFSKASQGQPLLLLASAYCQNPTSKPDGYADIRLDYLLDRGPQKLRPYAVTLFFAPGSEQNAGGRSALNTLAVSLGKDYKVVHEKVGMQFYALEPFKAFDDEGDPRDMCRLPRPQKFLVVVKQRASSNDLEFLMIADIDAYCQHGDSLSQQKELIRR